MSNKPAKVKKIQNLVSFHSRLLATTSTNNESPRRGNKRSLPRVVTSDEIVENGSNVSSNGTPATMCNERFSTASNKHREYERAKKRVRTKTPTPQNVLNSILYDNGMSMLSVSFDKIPKSFFFEQNKDRTACTTTQHAFVEAIRRGDLESLHALEVNKLRLRVVDSSGRSPLHDALRSINAHSHFNMELIDKLLKQCPELLFINDSLGKTPLAYVTKQNLVKEFDSYLKSQTSWLTECAIRFALQMTS